MGHEKSDLARCEVGQNSRRKIQAGKPLNNNCCEPMAGQRSGKTVKRPMFWSWLRKGIRGLLRPIASREASPVSRFLTTGGKRIGV
jgi:hypothetical protein